MDVKCKWLVALSCGLLMFSCERSQEAFMPPVQGEQMTFTARWADKRDSKTAIQPNGVDIWWTPSEQISLFYGNKASAVFSSVNEEPVPVTEFTGSINIVTGGMDASVGQSWFVAVYPYKESNRFDGQHVTLTLPHLQTGVEGSFADKFFPAVARSRGTDLAFYNVCGGARVVRVVFASCDGTPLAGTARLGFSDAGTPELLSVEGAVDSVIVNAPQGGFVPGTDYFAALLPGTHAQGLAVRLYTARMSAVLDLPQEITIRRSVFGALDDVDEGLEYQDSEFIPVPEPTDSIVFADSLVRKICLQYFDTDRNGKLSSEEAEAVRSFGTYFVGKPVSSFMETVYFSGVTSFDGAFNGCHSLQRIAVPVWVTSIGNNTFNNCISLESVSIPAGVTSLGVNCFYGCTSLEEVDFSEGLLNVGNYAFYGCSSLQRVHLPSTVASVGKYAFGSCTGLLSVVFPSALTAVGDYAFVGCSALQKVDLEPCAGLLTIGASAFSGCTGTTGEDITLPASVTAVGSAALTPFKYVNVLGTTPPVIATDSFIGTARFGVPAQSLKTYKKALNWKKYQNWIYPDTTFCYPPSMTQISADRRQLNLFGVTLDFIKVSAGQYTSGSKTVTLTKDYWLAEAELSRALWIAVMNADPSNFTPTMDIAIHCPVTRVSWEDVFTYISALNRLVPSTYRLPSEAEWEFAARGGNQSQGYTYSGGNVLADVAWYTANSKCCLDTTGAVRQQPHPYGERQANELGFYDMSGNVYEWVNDYWSTSAPSGTDPTGPVNDANKRRVMRGGDYISSEQFCTVSYRTYKKQGENGSNLGFRLAL